MSLRHKRTVHFIRPTPERLQVNALLWWMMPKSYTGYVIRKDCFDCLLGLLVSDPVVTRHRLDALRTGLEPLGKAPR